MKKEKIVVLAAAAAAVAVFTACSAGLQKSGTINAGRHIIEYRAETTEQQRKKAVEEAERIDAAFALLGPESEIARINAQSGSAVKPSSEAMSLIKTALAVSELSGGAYDATALPYERLWSLDTAPRVPSEMERLEAGTVVGYQLLTISGDSLTAMPKMQIGVSPLLDAYVAQRVGDTWRSGGKAGMLACGDTVYAYGEPNPEAPFVAEINPNRMGAVGSVVFQNAAVSTVRASDGAVIDGIAYCSVINPKTGLPADSAVQSATIICKNAPRAAAIARAVIVTGSAAQMYKDAGDFEYVVVYKDGSVELSPGAAFTPAAEFSGKIITIE